MNILNKDKQIMNKCIKEYLNIHIWCLDHLKKFNKTTCQIKVHKNPKLKIQFVKKFLKEEVQTLKIKNF